MWEKIVQQILTSLTSRQVLLAPVVCIVSNAIRWINHYPVDSIVCFANNNYYWLESNLSSNSVYFFYTIYKYFHTELLYKSKEIKQQLKVNYKSDELSKMCTVTKVA